MYLLKAFEEIAFRASLCQVAQLRNLTLYDLAENLHTFSVYETMKILKVLAENMQNWA